MTVHLNQTELRLLVQSLTHCLESCKHKQKNEPCEDCEAGKKLKGKLQKILTTR